jgi:hypothetical protein
VITLNRPALAGIALGAILGIPLAALAAAALGITASAPAGLGIVTLLVLNAALGAGAWELGLRPLLFSPGERSASASGSEAGAGDEDWPLTVDADDDPAIDDAAWRLVEHVNGQRYAWPASEPLADDLTPVDDTLYTYDEISALVGEDEDGEADDDR